jgi:hypothetical protein
MKAERFDVLQPGLFRWSAFSPQHKVELTSHAVSHEGTMFVFDPIPVADATLAQLNHAARAGAVAVILTNANHLRDTAAWVTRGKPCWAPAELLPELPGARDIATLSAPGWRVVVVHGGAPGERAFCLPERSLVVFGDAVVNLPGRALELLPDRYCTDPIGLRQSMAGLISAPFETAVFAHGDPLISRASERIAALLERG